MLQIDYAAVHHSYATSVVCGDKITWHLQKTKNKQTNKMLNDILNYCVGQYMQDTRNPQMFFLFSKLKQIINN